MFFTHRFSGTFLTILKTKGKLLLQSFPLQLCVKSFIPKGLNNIIHRRRGKKKYKILSATLLYFFLSHSYVWSAGKEFWNCLRSWRSRPLQHYEADGNLQWHTLKRKLFSYQCKLQKQVKFKAIYSKLPSLRGETDYLQINSDMILDYRSEMLQAYTGAFWTQLLTQRGDDVFGEDPFNNELESRLAVSSHGRIPFLPSGTMTNQVAINAIHNPAMKWSV